MSHPPPPRSASDNAQSLSLQTGWSRPPHSSQPSNESPPLQSTASSAMNSSNSGRPTGLGSPDAPGQALQQPSNSATPHRPNPSPVQTNYTSYRSPNPQSQPRSSASPAQDSPSSAIASSPVDRNLSGPTFADSPDAPRSGSLSPGPSVTTEVTNPPSEPGRGATPPETSTNEDSRSLPDAARPSGSPTAWPSIPKKAAGRAAQRMMPRTSSIDSAISSLSLGSHSHKSSFDANSVTSADINNLIAAAGSAEALILHLLKDKHHASSQNEQLWRLLEKQRALVLGLNRDLERALQDKELYRKKFKELQSQLHEMRSRLAAAEEANARNGAAKASAQSASKDGPGPARESVRNSDVFLIQSNAEPAPGETAPDSQPSTSHADASSHVAGPEHSTNEATLPAPSRKPPPAPLDLARTQRKHTTVDAVNDSQSESNYDDHSISDDDEERRGRRRTREEDDREREVMALREQEARSRSKKQAKQLGAASNKDADSTQSPWRMATQSPSHINNGQFPRTDSLAAIVNSGPRDPSLLSDRHAPPTPGLPSSPRPADRPLGSPLPRQPRQGTTIVSPPLSPKSATHGSLAPPHATKPPVSPQLDYAPRQVPIIDPSVKIDSPKTPYGVNRTICQDLVSEEYPGLLLPPNALPSIEVKVASSRLRPSRSSYFGGRSNDEDPVFVLSVFSRANRAELWRVEKAIQALPQLDQQIRQMCDFHGKLPDRSIFSGHSPAKIDARRDALNAYFETLLDTPMSEAAAIVVCRFLSTDAIEPRDDESALVKANGKTTPELVRGPDGKPWKEGWLTKRGKNFGGWKSRYFVLHGPEFKYYESPGGPHLGTIRIQHAQIGKQAQSGHNQSPSRLDDDHDNQYRHAFLILEPKRKDPSSFVRHVLCAESDEERDAWVDALLAYVEPHSDEEAKAAPKSHSGKHSARSRLFSGRKNGKGADSPDVDTQDTVQGFSYDDAVAAEPPMYGPSYEAAAKTSTEINDSNGQGNRAISGPTNGTIIQDAGAWGNKTTSVKEKKRSIWGFRTRSTLDLLSQSQESNSGNSAGERREASRPVFGMPLAEAVQYCSPHGVDVELPAVVYRCIEYLRAKNAASEEGIFRLSGSNVVVKALKERFNAEGDVDFLAGDEYHDVHAVASLFKQYLRELPTSVLTRDLHPEFVSVLEYEDREQQLVAFNSLVHRLPRENRALLSAISKFLIEIVNNAEVNKMTVRNVGIVFAPTLNIPAPVFSMFLTDYERIFCVPPDDSQQADSYVPSSSGRHAAGEGGLPRHQSMMDVSGSSHEEQIHQQRCASQDGWGGRDVGYGPGPTQRMLNPDDSLRATKAKRRESSMLFMDLGHRRPSHSQLREGDTIAEESLYE